MEFQEVKFGAVTLVLAKAILRETRAEVAHNRIASHFRDHTGGCDGEAVAITVDDRRLREGEGEYREAVDEDVFRLHGEAGDCGAHRFVSGAQNIDRIDLDGIDHADRPRDRSARDQLVVNFLAFLRQKLLRVVQLFVPEFFRKNNCCCYDRPGKCAATGFINAGDGGNSKRPQFAFMPESAAPIHGGKILKS
jgi:hypothetical protein